MMNEAMLCSLVGLCGAVQSTIYTIIEYDTTYLLLVLSAHTIECAV